ncbi:MAG: hypothetical protein FGM38_04315 [Solirubrobacterales bacterium]|nr:hypothetical protein [Solirubrobacterales bacterium]
MNPKTPPLEESEKSEDPDRVRLGTILGVGALVVGGLLVWALVPGGRAGRQAPVDDPFNGARLVSLERAGEMVEAVGHPVFWAGRLPGMRVAMNEDSRQNVHVRYLPDGVDPETSSNQYFTVGSYPFSQAFEATSRLAGEPGRAPVEFPGGVGFLDRMRGDRLVLSFRGHPDLQVEVFHPRLGRALEAVRTGGIVPMP